MIQHVSERKAVNVEQASKKIGCSRSHTYRLCECGDLEYYRYGRVQGIRIYLDSVNDYLKKKEMDG